jgi:predicted DNA-binding transcriptional regulator AlpA
MDQRDFTIDEWCHLHQCCRATYYNLKKNGKAPKTYQIGKSTRITRESDAEWVRQRQAETAGEAEAEVAARDGEAA